MEIMIAMLVGTLAGLHVSTWGMYKDSPHEGFGWPKYFRSTIIGMILGPIVLYILNVAAIDKLDIMTARGMLLLWGSVYVTERAIVEVWKTFFRTVDQTKYFIPMQLHVLGRVVESKRDRFIAGSLYILGVVVVGWLLVTFWSAYQAGTLGWSPWLILVPLSIGGWISAFGGAWKDAPIEGFETFKFFRSPGVAYFYAFIPALLTDNFIAIACCSLGFTIASIETYKTFFFPSRPRGKFQGKPIDFPEMLVKRQRFIPVFVGIWIFVLTCVVLAFMGGPYQSLIKL